MAVWRDVGRCRSAMVHQLYEVWEAKRGAVALPVRAAFDPAEIKSLLSNLLISEFEFDPFRVRYRLIGTRVAAAASHDFTGRYLDEVELATGTERWRALYQELQASRHPLFGSVVLGSASGDSYTYEFGIFPVTTDGVNATQCLGIEDYGDYNHRLGELQEKVEKWRLPPVTGKRQGR